MTSSLGDFLRDSLNDPHSLGALDEIFSEEPVPLSVFVQDSKFLRNPPLSEVQYNAVRAIERVYFPQTYAAMGKDFAPYWRDDIPLVNFVTLQWGKGSGKDHVCRIASLRVAYLLLCLHNPQDYYNMPPQDTIHLLNVASSSAQAQQAFFNPITRAVKKGWFANRCDPKVNVVTYEKGVECISGHSDSETQEGLNLMLGIADEIDAFRARAEMRFTKGSREPTKSAEGILELLRSSGRTRFPEVFKNVRISYPRYLGSTIQQLTNNAKKDVAIKGIESKHYVSGPLATWEVNPRVPNKAAFLDDYDSDAAMARSKYECKPSRAVSPYFRNDMAVEACMIELPRQPLEVTYELEHAPESLEGRAWVPKFDFDPDLYPMSGAIYCMHADLAISGDRAGVAMAHVVRYEDQEVTVVDEDGMEHKIRETRPFIKVDFVITFEADASATPAREIQVRWARQLCFLLVQKGFNIKTMSFDNFASEDSRQILEAKGIESKRVSTDISEEPWRNLRDLMYEGRVRMPKLQLLLDELLSLSKLPNGKVDHPSGKGSSKDAADALACAVLGAVMAGGEEGDERTYFSPADFELVTVVGVELPTGFNANELFSFGGDPNGERQRY